MEESGKIKPLLEMEHNSAEYFHALIEALRYATHCQQGVCLRLSFCYVLFRLAFAGALGLFRIRLVFAQTITLDSRYYVTDPDVEHVPVKELLSKVIFEAIPSKVDSDTSIRNISGSAQKCLIPRRLPLIFAAYVTHFLSKACIQIQLCE
jgi:hypothetical protein